MFFIQGAHGALEGFLAHTEALLNILGGRTVSKGQSASGLLQFVQQLVGKIAEASLANALQREVELAVGAHINHGGGQHIASMGFGLEYLVVVNESRTAVIGHHLEAEGCFLLYYDLHFLSAVVVGGPCGLQVALHLGRSHNALGLGSMWTCTK